MGFIGNGARFTGDDGFGKDAAWGAEIIGDASAALAAGSYVVLTTAASSTLPSNTTGTEIGAGDVLIVDDAVTSTITPAVGDTLVTLALTDRCDLSSWSMEFSKEEIDVTVLCDAIKKYRTGKADMAGTQNGIFVAGSTDKVNGDMQEFIDIVRQDGDTSWDRYEQQEEIKLGFFYVNKDTTLADEMFVVAPYQSYGMTLGGEMGSPQSFSGSFRFAPLTYTSAAGADVTVQPTFHRVSAS